MQSVPDLFTSVTENPDVNVYILFISSCLIVAFSRLELCENTVTFRADVNNQAVEICFIVRFIKPEGVVKV